MHPPRNHVTILVRASLGFKKRKVAVDTLDGRICDGEHTRNVAIGVVGRGLPYVFMRTAMNEPRARIRMSCGRMIHVHTLCPAVALYIVSTRSLFFGTSLNVPRF